MAKRGNKAAAKQEKPCSCRGEKFGRPHSRFDCEVLRAALMEAQRIEAAIAENYELRRRGC